jgi:SAM-dependent methyltransferase
MSRVAPSAAVYTPIVLRLYDWWVLEVSNRLAWQCPTSTVLLPFFAEHLGARHLDVGVGTGYYVVHADVARRAELTLLDLNENSLRAAAARGGARATTVRHDVTQPLPASLHDRFDSVSLFYLLHCLPGSMLEKEVVIAGLKSALASGGVMYGATILGDAAGHNGFGRQLMRIYNRKGIFGNRTDTLESLEAALRRHFGHVEVRQQGKVALFVAREPLKGERGASR